MTPFNLLVLIALALLVGYGIIVYNRLVTLKHHVGMAWANLDYRRIPRRAPAHPLFPMARRWLFRAGGAGVRPVVDACALNTA
jgi:LemA protein